MKTILFKPTKMSGGSLVAAPLVGHTETFCSLGAFDTEEEALNAQKYIKTKFARALLAVKKVTQNETPHTWEYVPLQDFTANSDIDWSKSLDEIDTQLFDKYGLDLGERLFIRTSLASMEDEK